ncbi:MAG: class I mannose-6-phosphate isomerase [Mycoplasmoidaceae bacterium]|nr:class I mannose-6-phosphate isomerase [Mycoplasmoidaceae bacterium]
MGFNQACDKTKVEASLKDGSITNLLNHIQVQEGDSYLIEPGTIHAIGKDTLLIEIQQSADITYRLYDFNRVDVNGKPRELHINEALECINYNQLSVQKNEPKEQLISCKFFNVFKQQIGGIAQLKADEKSFHSLTVLDGKMTVELADQIIHLGPYETCFVAANSGDYKLGGNATFIRVTL